MVPRLIVVRVTPASPLFIRHDIGNYFINDLDGRGVLFPRRLLAIERAPFSREQRPEVCNNNNNNKQQAENRRLNYATNHGSTRRRRLGVVDFAARNRNSSLAPPSLLMLVPRAEITPALCIMLNKLILLLTKQAQIVVAPARNLTCIYTGTARTSQNTHTHTHKHND